MVNPRNSTTAIGFALPLFVRFRLASVGQGGGEALPSWSEVGRTSCAMPPYDTQATSIRCRASPDDRRLPVKNKKNTGVRWYLVRDHSRYARTFSFKPAPSFWHSSTPSAYSRRSHNISKKVLVKSLFGYLGSLAPGGTTPRAHSPLASDRFVERRPP